MQATYLGLIECVDEILIVQDVALRLKEKLQDAIFNCLQLILVSIDPHNELVSLLLQVWTLQPNNITGRISKT